MKQNKYDDEKFFSQYSKMGRSVQGLEGAGEWYILKKLFPDFKGKRVLDLGCGFGWHCRYAAEKGAEAVTGVDISEKMLKEAKKKTNCNNIKYLHLGIEDIDFKENSFDIVISSLAFHYVKSFYDICLKVHNALAPDGDFVFSAEHPVFTACGTQDWCYDSSGNIIHWPVDNYYIEGQREATFLGEKIIKYHKTMTTYLDTLLKTGFNITGFAEAEPAKAMIEKNPEFKNELRRPMIFIISAKNIK